jgi:hypothetical protein
LNSNAFWIGKIAKSEKCKICRREIERKWYVRKRKHNPHSLIDVLLIEIDKVAQIVSE